eukprot:s2459_g14.t1
MIYISNAIEFCLGVEISRNSFIDSTSAKALLTRQGVGRTRHLDGKLLWVQGLTKQDYVVVSGVNTFRNVADIGTKALSRERILCLLCILGVVNCNDNYSRVGVSEHAEMEQKLALKQEVRRLERRVALPQQRNIMYQALRIAVVLNELNHADALSPHVSPITFCVHSWNVVPVVAFVCVLFCSMLLQGCDSHDMINAYAELWFYELIELVVANPGLGLVAGFIVLVVPWLIVLVINAYAELWFYELIELVVANPGLGLVAGFIVLVVPWLIVLVFARAPARRMPRTPHHVPVIPCLSNLKLRHQVSHSKCQPIVIKQILSRGVSNRISHVPVIPCLSNLKLRHQVSHSKCQPIVIKQILSRGVSNRISFAIAASQVKLMPVLVITMASELHQAAVQASQPVVMPGTQNCDRRSVLQQAAAAVVQF